MSTILILEDEPVVMNVLRIALRKDNHEVLEATTPQDGIGMAHSFGGSIDLVIANHSLARKSAHDIIEDILHDQPHAEVLRISGHLRQNLEREGEIRPDSHFLQKPFTPDQLRAKVHEIMESLPR